MYQKFSSFGRTWSRYHLTWSSCSGVARAAMSVSVSMPFASSLAPVRLYRYIVLHALRNSGAWKCVR